MTTRTLERLESLIREMSDKAFCSHKITQQLNNGMYRSWLCRNPSRSAYWFQITTIPGTLLLTGDLGSLVVSRSEDMVAFCRRSIDSTSYFAEKCQDANTKVFSHDAVREWISSHREYLNETAEDYDAQSLARQREQLDEVDNRLHELDWRGVYEIAEDCFDPGEPPSWDEWDSQFLWRRDAIRWFVNHVTE